MDGQFLSLVKKFNELMADAITGPNCIDRKICRGDCCSIKIDISKELAEEFIKMGIASKEDFIRSDVFSFHLRFDEQTGKCFLFDKELNGCKVHNTGIKPPQCWIYPTNFSTPRGEESSCKRAGGWKIIDLQKTKRAEELLETIIEICKSEAKDELKQIENRLNHTINSKNSTGKNYLIDKLMKFPPCKLAGIRDTWDRFEGLPAQGISLQLKKFCQQHARECKYLPGDFLECKGICEEIAGKLIKFFNSTFNDFIEKNGPDTEGSYPFYKLFKIAEKE